MLVAKELCSCAKFLMLMQEIFCFPLWHLGHFFAETMESLLQVHLQVSVVVHKL